MPGIRKGQGKKTSKMALSPQQVKALEKLTGHKMTALLVETEPFESPPLGTTVLGRVFTDPRTKVVARINARFK